jgi:hypothetical protein
MRRMDRRGPAGLRVGGRSRAGRRGRGPGGRRAGDQNDRASAALSCSRSVCPVRDLPRQREGNQNKSAYCSHASEYKMCDLPFFNVNVRNIINLKVTSEPHSFRIDLTKF